MDLLLTQIQDGVRRVRQQSSYWGAELFLRKPLSSVATVTQLMLCAQLTLRLLSILILHPSPSDQLGTWKHSLYKTRMIMVTMAAITSKISVKRQQRS